MTVLSEGGRFGIVPEWLITAGEPQAVRLYAHLASKYADHDGEAYPSRSRLGRELGVSTKTIDRALANLVAVGALQIEHRKDPLGDSDTNVYHLRRIAPGVATNMSPGRDTDVAGGGDTHVPRGRDTDVALTRPSINQTHLNQTRGKLVTEEFIQEMVNIYGDRLGGSDGVRTAIEEACNHKAYDKRKDKRMYVRTWLRRENEFRQQRANGERQNGRTYREPVPDTDEAHQRRLDAIVRSE